MQYDLNGKTIDFELAGPLTIGDTRKLKLNHKLDISSEEQMKKIENISTFVLYMAKKANPDITQEDIDLIPLQDIMVVVQSLMNKSNAVLDRPT